MPRERDEPVRLTRIYTRAGDSGETTLGDGTRTSKLDPLVVAFGTVDELNAVLGWVLVEAPPSVAPWLQRIQNELFDVGADLSVPFDDSRERLRVAQEQIAALERECDQVNATLEPLKSFVLPGGSEYAARVHIARAVCRRAEREALAASRERAVNPLALAYPNRLSDLLFILARAANADAGEEPLWKPGASR